MNDRSNEDVGTMLSPYRVLDLTNELGFLCGKILGDLGADVIKIEPPGGDPSRKIGPFYHDEPDPEKSLYWFAYNNNKRGITLNLETPKGREMFKQLAQKADIVVESFRPGYLDSLGVGYSSLSEINPRIIVTSITPYGQKGPYSQWLASDLEIMASGGAMYLFGERDREPLRVSIPQSYMWGAMHGAAGSLVALYHQVLTGEGQHVDVASREAVILGLANAPAIWDITRTNPQRDGIFLVGRSVTGAKMRVMWPTKDGYVNFIIYGGPAGRRTNQALAEWMASVGKPSRVWLEKDWSKFDIATITQEEVDELEAPLEAFFKDITCEEFFKGVVERDMLGYPVATPRENLNDPQLAARGFWVKIEHPELGESITYPAYFAKFSETTCGIRRRAPLIGEHNEEVYAELGLGRAELAALKEANVI